MDGSSPPDVSRLSVAATADPRQLAALTSALEAAAAAVDAVADLVLAEGVFHLVGGQPARAGAATDALSGALVSPPAAEVVSTPVRGTGTERIACSSP